MLAATDWGRYGVFAAKYETLRCSDTTAKSSELKVLLGSHFIGKMASFREAREWIRLCYEINYISNDEFLLPHTSYKSQTLALPYDSFSEFDLESFEEDKCLAQFQFQKIHIPVLAEVLQIPPTVRSSQGSVYNLRWRRSFVHTVKAHVLPLSLQ